MIKKRVEFPASLLSIEWNSYNESSGLKVGVSALRKQVLNWVRPRFISWVNLPCLAGHFHKEFWNRFPPFKTGGLVWLRCQVKVSRNGPTQVRESPQSGKIRRTYVEKVQFERFHFKGLEALSAQSPFFYCPQAASLHFNCYLDKGGRFSFPGDGFAGIAQ